MNTRTKGKEGEDLVREHYRQQGYSLIEQNFTIKGGEIDLLMKKDKLLVAIEVKNLDTVEELDDYIGVKKIWHLQRTLDTYLRDTNVDQFKEIRIDAVFVQHGNIIEIYQDITNT